MTRQLLQLPTAAHSQLTSSASSSWRRSVCLRRSRRWQRRVCLPALLLLAAMTLIGFVEEHGGVRRWTIDVPAELLARLVAPSGGALRGGGDTPPTWRVLTFPSGQLSIGSQHPRLHRQLPTDRLELEAVRREVFASDVIGCSAQREFGGAWNLCSVGEFALARNRSCLAVYLGDGGEAFAAGRLPCSTVLGFHCSGLPASPRRSEAPLLDLLRLAATRGAPIDALLAQCPPQATPALEAAAHEGLLDTVKQLVLVTPAAVRHPLHQLHLQTALHAAGFRQWSHRQLPAEQCPAELQANCLHQRLLNERYLLDQAGLAKAAGWEAAQELQLAEGLSGLAPSRLHQLHRDDLLGPPHVRCPRARRLGDCHHHHHDDHDNSDCWHLCFSEAFNVAAAEPNCVALTFGDADGRSVGGRRGGFQDELVDLYGCWVYRFSVNDWRGANGTATRRSHRQRKTLWRYRTRLGRSNSMDAESGLKVRTLCSIIRRLGYDPDRPIDIVKLDARHHHHHQEPPLDWAAGLSGAIKEGCLSQVKQLILVTDRHIKSADSDGADYYPASHMVVWQDLMKLGFRVWQWHSLPADAAACCDAHYLVNLHFSSLSLYVGKL